MTDTGSGGHPPNWYPDPMGRHEYRWFDGSTWTDQVSSHGKQSIDPVAAQAKVPIRDVSPEKIAQDLAKAGITAGRDTLDGRTGMNRLMVGPDYEELRDTITHIEHGQNLRYELESVGTPLLITEHKFRVKRFPTCGAIHRAMDGVIDLKAAHGFTAADVASVDLHMPRVHFNNVFYTDPQSPLEAKFSAEYAVGCVLARGDCTLSDFTDEKVWGDDVRGLFPIIHRHPVDKLEGEFPTEVHITLKDGRQFTSIHEWPKGSKAAPFTWAEYWGKFDGCCIGVLEGAELATLRDLSQRLPDLADAGDLMRAAAFTPVS